MPHREQYPRNPENIDGEEKENTPPNEETRIEKKPASDEEAEDKEGLASVIKHEQTILERMRGKSKSIARVLVFVSAFVAGMSFKKTANAEEAPKGRTVSRLVEKTKQSTETKENAKSVEEIRAEAINNPTNFLFLAYNHYRDMPGLDLANEIKIAATKEPGFFIYYAYGFRDVLGAELANEISKAAERKPDALIRYVDKLQNIPGLDLVNELIKAGSLEPEYFAYNLEKLKTKIPKSDWLKIAEKFLENYPTAVINNRELLQSAPDNPHLKILKKLSNPETAIFLNDFARHGLQEKEAIKLMADEDNFLRALIKIKTEPGHLGDISVTNKIHGRSLQKIIKINSLHDEPNDVRFKPIQKFNAAELYMLMVYSEKEIYTSSFSGIFKQFINKLKKEGLGGDELLKIVGHDKFRTFLRECSGFNRLDEFLSTMDDEAGAQLLSDSVKNLGANRDRLEQAAMLADIFSAVKDKKTLAVLQEQIKKEYKNADETEQGQENKILYGILAGIFADKAVADETYFKEMTEKYSMQNLQEIKNQELFNEGGVNIQQHFFYNDKDGETTFDNFLNQYQKLSGWKIEKTKHYVKISATKEGKTIEIYANYPEAEETGQREISNLLQKQNTPPTMVVHRGHSKHVDETIKHLSPNVKIVSLGSCGGYMNVAHVLEGSPQAQILSTKGTGRTAINEPLLKMLNLTILNGQDINWSDFWAKLGNIVGKNDDFLNYVPPHQNLGAALLQTYNKLRLQSKN